MTTIRPDLPIQNLAPLARPARTDAASQRTVAAPLSRPVDTGLNPLDLRTRLSQLNLRADKLQRADIDAQKQDDVLARVGGLIDELSNAVAAARDSADGSAIDSSRADIDRILGSIRTAAEQAVPGRSTVPEIPLDWYRAENVSSHVEQLRFDAFLGAGERFDVDVQVTASAQVAGFYLSFGGDHLNLSSADSRFVIDVRGDSGTRELSFASGTSVQDIANAINSVSDATGVEAMLSGSGGAIGNGIVLRTADVGSSEFVSVRVIDSGGINTATANAGVYEFRDTDTNVASLAQRDRTLFSAANLWHNDTGQDVHATINGVQAASDGTRLRFEQYGTRVQFDLTLDAAQRVHDFRAFTITQTGDGSQAADGIGTLASSSSRELLAVEGRAEPLITSARDTVESRRRTIDEFRRNTILPQINALNEEVAAAMGGGGAGARAGFRPEPLTSERAAALIAGLRKPGA